MTEAEFYEEVKKIKPPAQQQAVDDEVLPPNVFKAMIEGVWTYMTCTEDGRIVPLDDDWGIP